MYSSTFPAMKGTSLRTSLSLGFFLDHQSPSLQQTLVRELQALWACKHRFAVHGSLFKRPIKVGLICVSSDIPATRKIGGFLGHMSSQGCSRCKKSFSSVDGLDFSGFDRENWIPRTSNEHKHSAKRTLDETSYTDQQKLCSHLGAR